MSHSRNTRRPNGCRHGHEGWMRQKLMWDAERMRAYRNWVCGECDRLYHMRRRQRQRLRRIYVTEPPY